MLLAVVEVIGHDQLIYASRMNKAVVVFVKEERCVHMLVESGVTIEKMFVQVSPLAVPSTRTTVSGVPPFIPNTVLERQLQRYRPEITTHDVSDTTGFHVSGNTESRCVI